MWALFLPIIDLFFINLEFLAFLAFLDSVC
jgi:hypothetical protein